MNHFEKIYRQGRQGCQGCQERQFRNGFSWRPWRFWRSWRLAFLILVALPSQAPAQTSAEGLKKIVTDAVTQTIDQFKDQKLKETDLAVTLIDMRDAEHPKSGSFR